MNEKFKIRFSLCEGKKYTQPTLFTLNRSRSLSASLVQDNPYGEAERWFLIEKRGPRKDFHFLEPELSMESIQAGKESLTKYSVRKNSQMNLIFKGKKKKLLLFKAFPFFGPRKKPPFEKIPIVRVPECES